MNRYLHILFLLLLSITIYAQRAPITVTTILTPPYTTSLSTMAESGSTRLMVNLLVNDVTITEIPVKLHIKMESSGITIESIPTQAVAPMFLGGGEARVLTGDDFAQYLNLNNLNFKGFSKEVYIKNGQLPAGLWKFSVSVRHFYTNKTISNIGTVTAWITSYKPPVLTTPKEGEIAPSNAALPLTFSWQASKHTGGTAAIMYRFEMWERRVEGVPAQAVAASVPPIYTTETAGLTATVLPATLALEPGMKYCWRVTAYDPSGMVTIENNGESEVRTFQYFEKCPEVCGLTVDIKDDTGYASWEENRQHLGGYNFEFYDDEGTCHKTLWGSSTKTAGIGGEYGKTWHVRVQGLCRSGVEGPWSDWVDFKIPDAFKPLKDENGNTYECGREVPERVITNFELIDNIQKGDTLEDERGTTKYIVHSAIKNEDGSFRGLSYMKLSIWGVKVLGEYNNMKVNTDGVIIGRYAWKSVKSDLLVADPEAIEKWADELALEMAGATYNNTIKDTIVLEYSRGIVPFETIEREGGKYYAVTSDGHKEEITSFINGQKRVMVKDGDGHELVIDKDGNVMGVEEYKKCGGSSKLLSEHNAYRDSTMATSGNVKFSKVKDENYGFDEWRGAEYDKDVYDNFNGYRPTYIGAQKQSNIKVAASQTKGIRFITERGVPIIANTADNTLNLAIGTAGKQTVYAYSDSTLVGKLCIQAYDPKEVKVHVVRVNNGKQLELNKIADEVNRIYGSAVVRYTFDEIEPITIEYANKQHFVHGGKGTFQNYNADQKAAIKALPENADGNDYYLFFTECYNRLDTAGNTSKEAVNGYMPVGRHYGFIYNEYTNARTIAHELGHGTNSLHHTFSAESETFRTTEKTDNLMDYNAGEYLNHRQWQWSHEKHRNVLGFLDDEGESEERNNDNERILSILKEIREANQKDEAMLNISVNQSMTYTIDVPNANFTLGEGTLSYLKIENDKLSITEAETTIAPNELSEVVLEDKEYTKIVFHKTTSVGISEDVAFSIIVKTKEKQTLISYIHPYKITTEQLSNIYPNASTQTIKAVTEAINKYCNEFEINTPERMAHFLGQIGAETGDKLNKLSESPSYTARRIVEIFGYNKYGHLFEEAVLDETTYNYSYTPIDYSCSSCRTEAIDKGNSTFSMDETKIINAYAEIKEEKEVVINGQKVKKMLFNETPRTDVVREGENKTISKYVSNESYSDGRLRVKKQYIKSATLFDVTYACRMGNGAIETRDGSVYAGVGFIHLTGKSNYNDVIDFWNKMHPDDKLTLNHELIERAKTDVDLAMKLAMAYWKSKRVNKSVKSKTYNESESNKISYEINGGTNGRDSRQKNTKKAFDVLSK